VKIPIDCLGPMPTTVPFVENPHFPAVWDSDHPWARAAGVKPVDSMTKQAIARIALETLRDINHPPIVFVFGEGRLDCPLPGLLLFHMSRNGSISGGARAALF
jgi:hypothetical protein